MTKEQEALDVLAKHIEVDTEIDDFYLVRNAHITLEQALIKAEQNKKVIDELKTLVKYADFGKQKIISLAVLKNALKEVL